MSFPLAPWFDLTRPIPKAEADLAVAQMDLYALNDGLDPAAPAARSEYRALRNAVKEHNARFPQNRAGTRT